MFSRRIRLISSAAGLEAADRIEGHCGGRFDGISLQPTPYFSTSGLSAGPRTISTRRPGNFYVQAATASGHAMKIEVEMASLAMPVGAITVTESMPDTGSPVAGLMMCVYCLPSMTTYRS